MRIIITGATGSLGAYLTRYFAQKGHEVIATGRVANPPPRLLDFATYVQAEIKHPVEFPDADVCIHTAALSDDKATAAELYEPNVTGTRHVIEAAKNCNVFIHTSSSSVYLPSEKLITEELAGNQDNAQLSPYGYSKLQAEAVVQEHCHNPSVYILRPRALYGPGDKVILPRLLKLENKGKLMRPGGLNVNISMTHYENYARAIELCIHEPVAAGMKIYNVADTERYVLLNVVRTICRELLGYVPREQIIPVWVLHVMAMFKFGGITKLLIRAFTEDMLLDTSKIERELGYKPTWEFQSSFHLTKSWVESIGGLETVKKAHNALAWEV